MKAAGGSSDLLRRFSPPPELVRSAPRDVRLTSGGIVLMAFAWLSAIAALPLGATMYREARRQAAAAAALATDGVLVPAVVDRLWRKTDDGKPAYVALHFDAGGTPIYGERRMQLEAWRELREGSSVSVRYLPHSPHQWSVAGERRQDGMPAGLAYVVSSILIGLAVLLPAVVRSQRSLLIDGRAAPAVVTSFRAHKSSHGATHREIRYEFPLLGGGLAKGKATASKSAAVGDTICIVYDPDRPSRSRPYPFPLVTPNTNC